MQSSAVIKELPTVQSSMQVVQSTRDNQIGGTVLLRCKPMTREGRETAVGAKTVEIPNIFLEGALPFGENVTIAMGQITSQEFARMLSEK